MGRILDAMKDHLADLNPAEVAAWYSRLADFIEKKAKDKKVTDALAPQFLRHYLKGKGKNLSFPPPDHLKNSKYVVEALKDHRAWYLTEKPFNGKWVGIIPRLQQKEPLYTWPYTMKLNSLVEIDVKLISSNTPGDNDLLTSLHGFQLYTECWVWIIHIEKESYLKATLGKFTAKVADRYDFDPDKYFVVPNPDYKNPSKIAKPVEPDSEEMLVYHRNAIRMENAGLAIPFDLESEKWSISDQDIIGPEKVDPNKTLWTVPRAP
jgi:hypothetical protein